jgi:hypothetical protein
MLIRIRRLPWREFWAGVALTESGALIALCVWYMFLRG